MFNFISVPSQNTKLENMIKFDAFSPSEVSVTWCTNQGQIWCGRANCKLTLAHHILPWLVNGWVWEPPN